MAKSPVILQTRWVFKFLPSPGLGYNARMPKRTNAQWLADLRAAGLQRETALADLREICLAGLPYALAGWLSPDDPQYPALAQDVAQETLMRVLDHLGQFEGRSQFTTWVQKIAVRVALTELRRRRWKDVSLEGEIGPTSSVLADSAPQPETVAEQSDMLARVQQMMSEELTQKQRQAMAAMLTTQMPLEEIARRLGMRRNALYKLLHDARLRLKRRLAREGLTMEEVMAIFERG
jgi:RNA polymerase sigma-70 factor (ECF subfamily)